MRSSIYRRGQRRYALPLFVLMTAIACWGWPTDPVYYYFPGRYQLLTVDGRPIPDTLSLPTLNGPLTLYTLQDGMVDVNSINTELLILLKRMSDSANLERSGVFFATQVGDSLFAEGIRVAYQRRDTMVVNTGGTSLATTYGFGAHEWRLLKVSSQ